MPFTERVVASKSIDSLPDVHESSDEEEETVRFTRQYSVPESDAFNSALDKPWESLSGEELTAAQVLGYTEENWPQPCKDADDWAEWEEATAEERAAWVALGLDDEAWCVYARACVRARVCPAVSFTYARARINTHTLNTHTVCVCVCVCVCMSHFPVAYSFPHTNPTGPFGEQAAGFRTL